MGWKWEEVDEKGFGDVVNPNPRKSIEDSGFTRRIVKSSCRTEEVEPGKFVRKCEKTEQTLRDSLGRPAEVVESKTEHTEEDVTDEVTGSSGSFGISGGGPFSFPELRSDIEALERGLFGGLGHFLEAAEEMTNEFFRSFDISSRHNKEASPFARFPSAGKHRKSVLKRWKSPILLSQDCLERLEMYEKEKKEHIFVVVSNFAQA